MAVTLPAHVKVRLRFKVVTPTTQAALFMANMGVSGPFVEEVWVLVPKEQVFSKLGAYKDAFAALKEAGAVPFSAQLDSYAFTPEALPTTQGYVIGN
jgi:hypothetical protein